MCIDWSFVEKVIYINLENRKDRRSFIESEFKKVGIPKDKIIRFDAIEHPIGHLGCAMSHAKVMEEAIINNWGNILVLEDDMQFSTIKSDIDRVNLFFDTLRRIEWNMALLSANYHQVQIFKSTADIVRVLSTWCCGAYIVNATYIPILYQNFSESVAKLKQGGFKGVYACDVHWMHLSEKHTWLGMYPVVAQPKPDVSTIEGCYMDYTHAFQKSIEDIAINL
ncbi:glycosyltransferase [Salmonella enterica subsp. salamae]|nr:glycosyltransferase [Salmonella enterica subsp. salamae]